MNKIKSILQYLRSEFKLFGNGWFMNALIVVGTLFVFFTFIQVLMDFAFDMDDAKKSLAKVFKEKDLNLEVKGGVQRHWLPSPGFIFNNVEISSMDEGSSLKARMDRLYVSTGYLSMFTASKIKLVEFVNPTIVYDHSKGDAYFKKIMLSLKSAEGSLPREIVVDDMRFFLKGDKFTHDVKLKNGSIEWYNLDDNIPKLKFVSDIVIDDGTPFTLGFRADTPKEKYFTLSDIKGFFKHERSDGYLINSKWMSEFTFNDENDLLTVAPIKMEGEIVKNGDESNKANFTLLTDAWKILPTMFDTQRISFTVNLGGDKGKTSLGASLNGIKWIQKTLTAENIKFDVNGQSGSNVFLLNAQSKLEADTKKRMIRLDKATFNTRLTDMNGSGASFQSDLAGSALISEYEKMTLSLEGSFDKQPMSIKVNYEPKPQEPADAVAIESKDEANQVVDGDGADGAGTSTATGADVDEFEMDKARIDESFRFLDQKSLMAENRKREAAIKANKERMSKSKGAITAEEAMRNLIEPEEAEQESSDPHEFVIRIGSKGEGIVKASHAGIVDDLKTAIIDHVFKFFKNGIWDADVNLSLLNLTPYIDNVPTENLSAKDMDLVIPFVKKKLDAMDGNEIKGKLTVKKLNLSGWGIDDFTTGFNFSKEGMTLYGLECKSYGGTLKASVDVRNSTPMRFKLNEKLTDIDIHKWFTDWLGYKNLLGKGEVSVDVESRGSNMAELKSNLTGDSMIKIKNGAYVGIDLARIFNPNNLNLEYSPFDSWDYDNKLRTKFNLFKFPTDWINGTGFTNSLSLSAPGYSLKGSGKMNLPDGTVNYSLSLSGQMKIMKNTSNRTLPLKITGNILRPQYSLDYVEMTRHLNSNQKESTIKDILKQQWQIIK